MPVHKAVAPTHQIRNFTLSSMVIGAIPVPAASLGLVAHNAAMVAAIAASHGVPISPGSVIASMGPVGSLNNIGRAVFVEGARAIGWSAGPLGIAGVSMLGATTAGVQTWVLGSLAVALCQNGGAKLAAAEARAVVAQAKKEFKAQLSSLMDDLKRSIHGAEVVA